MRRLVAIAAAFLSVSTASGCAGGQGQDRTHPSTATTQQVDVTTAITKAGEIVVGKFVDRDRPDYMELLKAQMSETLGERFAEPQCISQDGGCCESEGATVCS